MASIVKKAAQQKEKHRRVQGKNRRRQQRHTGTKKKARAPRPLAWPQRLSRGASALLQGLGAVFCRPTGKRFLVLLFAAILTVGCPTILNLLRTAGALAPGDASSYHRVFSKRRWSLWRLARVLTGFIVQRWLPEGIIEVAGDDTVTEHKGKKVYGKACHRDAVRSSHTFTAYRWGHKWVVLAVLVRFPFAQRPWALPVLCALYHSEKWNQEHGRRHKTPVELLRQLLVVLARWFPQRHLRRFVGDGSFATQPFAAFAQRHGRVTVVSRFYGDANLYEPPPTQRKKGAGRPRVKGARLPKPNEVVAKCRRRRRLQVAWYGGGRRDISVVSGVGHWYKAGHGLVKVRWVHVRDRSGTHRDEYFFSTLPTMTPQEIVEAYCRRWNLETTFQEMRSYLKLEKTRGWSERTVLRTAPCLFALYSVIAMLYAELPSRWQQERAVCRPGKTVVTFSDAITAVRRWLWSEWVFATPGLDRAFAKIPHRLRDTLLHGLAPAE